jgi:hypothetical protein
MEQAHALDPSARTLRGLGIIAYAEGRQLEAVGFLEQALTSSQRPLTPALRAAVEELLGRIWQQNARLRLSLEPAESVVLVDAQIPAWHGPSELLLTPGKHGLTVSAPGHSTYQLDLTLQAGASETLRVALARTPAQDMPPRAPQDAVQARTVPTETSPVAAQTTLPQERAHAAAVVAPATRSSAVAKAPTWWTTRLRNTTLIAGATVALGGAALWLTAWRRHEIVQDYCNSLGGCTRERAEQSLEISNARTYARAAAALTAVAGVALTGALAIELWQRAHGADQVVIGIAPSGLTLHKRF